MYVIHGASPCLFFRALWFLKLQPAMRSYEFLNHAHYAQALVYRTLMHLCQPAVFSELLARDDVWTMLGYGALQLKDTFMSHLLKIIAIAAFVASGAILAGAQTTTKDSPSKAQPGAPDQGPGNATQPTTPSGVGSAPIGPPATSTDPTTKQNPTGMSEEKKKSETNDPQQGGKKQ